ncbi:putative sugar O-methyltransferase [Pontibacter roseus]|uniref:putative sugar O-methyltransferase n=1 Tax=Pontibacter roseus TaxID=336989 RepID=UPI001B7FA752|nr:putative sugar O-methyltransferase [Pontibacter roseus]
MKKVELAMKKAVVRGLLRVKDSISTNKLYRMSTSLSDNQVYPDFCAKANIDAALFSNFRRNEVYCLTLEHVSEEYGKLYLDTILKENVHLLKSIELFKENDVWGNPRVFEYENVGKISPTTLRYIKVLSDLLKLFSGLDGMKICEIGVGYGGQCRIIDCATSPSAYTLVDIKPALMLTQRYLDNYILDSVLSYKTMNELKVETYDLVISNYAFTELPRKFQDVYLKKIILNSNSGYITYNEITPEAFESYKRDELLRIIPNSYIIDEEPLTHAKNCIIVWNKYN